jgi:hypothetical protein
MRRAYTPSDWYWLVSGQVYSSKAASYVASDAPAYLAWMESGGRPTKIASAVELWAVLAAAHPAGLPADASAQDARKEYELTKADTTLFRIAFNHENRIRALEGKASITVGQFRTAVKDLM